LVTDFNLASIFSQHRPVSITTPLPSATTEETFNSIFEATTDAKHKSNDVLLTLGSVVERLDQASQARQSGDLSWNILQESPNGEVTHLDGSNGQAFLAKYPPFTPPPAPSAFDPAAQSQKMQQRPKRESRKRQPKATTPQTKTWSTTVVVTEYTNQDGTKSWSAETTPIVRALEVAQEVAEPEQQPKVQIQQPFLQRMRLRHIQTIKQYKGGRMLAISVKRQRKLKMKKHKYKKLMRRTRNLRRRLDRN